MSYEPDQLSAMSRRVIASDRFDRRLYREVLNESPSLQAAVRHGNTHLATFSDLVQDVFTALNNPCPSFVPLETIRCDGRINHTLLQRLMDTAEWRTLREDTVGDRGAATIGTLQMAHKLAHDLISNPVLSELVESFSQVAHLMHETLLHEGSGNYQVAGVRYAQAFALGVETESRFQVHTADVGTAARNSVLTARKSVEEMVRILGVWGLGHGERQTLSVEKQEEILQRLSSAHLR